MVPFMTILQAVQKNEQQQNENNKQDGSNHFASGLGGIGGVASTVYNGIKEGRGEEKKGSEKNPADTTQSAGATQQPAADVGSDARLKQVLGDEAPVEAFSRINAYLFKYKPEAQELYNGKNGVDDREHVGVMAQELAENPVTAAAVQEDENGFLEIDTGKLCTALAAVVADLSRRVLELEDKISASAAETKGE